MNIIIKRATAYLLTFFLLLSLMPIDAFAHLPVDSFYDTSGVVGSVDKCFSDTKGHWAEKQIEKWSSLGVLGGFPDGTFKPDDLLTRAQFAKILDAIMKYQTIGNENYADVSSGSWYHDVILKLSKAGILYGDNGYAQPDKSITRYEAAVLCARAFMLSVSGDYKSSFSDDGLMPGWSADSVRALAVNGYIGGKDDGNFHGDSGLTRAEAITIINNIIAMIVTEKGTFNNNIKGNVVINTPSVELGGMFVDGSVYITEGVGDGEVTLQGTKLSSDVIIKGGGTSTVNLNDVTATGLYASKQSSDVRVYFSKCTFDTPVRIGNNVIIDGNISNVELTDPGSKVTVKGSVESLVTDGSETNLTINGTVDSLAVMSDGVKIAGNGKITSATVKGENTSFEKYPDSLSLDPNKSVKVGDDTYTGGSEGKTIKEPSSDSGSSGGGGGGGFGGGGGGGGSVESSDATLKSLVLSAGTLSPDFSKTVYTYTAAVENSVDSVTVTAVPNDTKISGMTVNGSGLKSGTASSAIALAEGANTLAVLVKAEDGTAKTYTITVTRQAAPPVKSSNANLSGLALSAGILSPGFSADATAYSVTVENGVSSVAFTPIAADPKYKGITINSYSVLSGNTSLPVSLNVGSNTVTIVVTAEDDTVKTYIVTVTRQDSQVPELSSNANLSGLTLSAGMLSPAFLSDTTSYTASVSNSETSLNVTPVAADSKYKSITVNNTAVLSGNQSGAILLSVGDNTVTIVVTAENNSTKTYTVKVTRAASSNNELSALVLSSGTLSP
ncbi:MAG: cadherin-like beta sandwich domain-containing protein, partial [Bacillota bacterium]|nr:cadherin-like beta sandwich domain-containing protein [Bacillota bacterium]